MSMRVRPAAVVVLALLTVLTAIAAPAAAAPSTVSAADAATQSDDNQSLDSNTTLAIQLNPDGSASWTVTASFQLEDEGDREAFDQLRDEFERGRGDVLGLGAFKAAADNASKATGRSMRLTNVSRSSDVVNDTGKLHLTFRWTSFARLNGSRLSVGDAFNTTNGTWLPELGPDQTLVIRPPQGYAVDTASTGPDDGVLRWEGPQRFDPGDLEATYQRVDNPGEGDSPLLLAVLVVLGGAVLVAAAYILVQQDFGSEDDEEGAVASNGGEDGVGGSAAAAAVDDPDESVDEELLSDEERIEHLLAANGGRMKQANIVKETGWSNAKVSQLLSAMDDEDRVNKLRIGRENLITDPEEDVGDLES